MRVISVRLSRPQLAHVALRAAEHGESVSEFVRRLIDADRGAQARSWREAREVSWATAREGSWERLREEVV